MLVDIPLLPILPNYSFIQFFRQAFLITQSPPTKPEGRKKHHNDNTDSLFAAVGIFFKAPELAIRPVPTVKVGAVFLPPCALHKEILLANLALPRIVSAALERSPSAQSCNSSQRPFFGRRREYGCSAVSAAQYILRAAETDLIRISPL